jgi:hypothetical protein
MYVWINLLPQFFLSYTLYQELTYGSRRLKGTLQHGSLIMTYTSVVFSVGWVCRADS